MNKYELFYELLHTMQDLASFAPYVFRGIGADEGMLRSKLRATGERLISAADDGQEQVKK